MILQDIKKIKSREKDLRSFAKVMGFFFLILGAFLWWRGKSSFGILLAISIFFFLSGSFFPKLLLPLQKAWMTLSILIGWVMSRIILSLIFYGVLTPLSLLARLTGKKFLNLGFRDSDVSSYWISREGASKEKKSYEQQF